MSDAIQLPSLEPTIREKLMTIPNQSTQRKAVCVMSAETTVLSRATQNISDKNTMDRPRKTP